MLRELVSHAERTWLDVRVPVLTERLHSLGWEADSPGDYCTRCGQGFPPGGAADRPCDCASRRLPWSRIVRLGPYRPPLTRMVHEVKFTRWRRLGTDLGRLLGASLASAIAQARLVQPDLPQRILVIPVPTTLRRRLRRGIDHPHVIARGVAGVLGARVCSRVISRRHRPSQLLVLPSEREANMAGSFHPRRRPRPDLSGTLVIVVDDVTTTGATLRGACRAVRKAHRDAGGGPLQLWAAVLAVTELEEG